MKKFGILIFLAFAIISHSLAEVKTVAVVDFEVTAGAITKNEAESITELYMAELLDTGRVTVIDRDCVKDMLRELKFGSSDWGNPAKTAKLGEALNVQLISRGKVIKLGNKFFISTSLMDAKTAKIVSSAKLQFSSLNEVPSLLLSFARATVDGLSIKIGDIGLGGGYVFYIEGDRGLECSEILGTANWNEAKELCKNYRGGNYSDWRLPTKEELNYIYVNLRKLGRITGNDWYWSSSAYNDYFAWGQKFSGGGTGCDDKDSPNAVRAVRSFSLLAD